MGVVSVLTLPEYRPFRRFPLRDRILDAVSVLTLLVDGAGPAQNGAGPAQNGAGPNQNGAGPGSLARVCFWAGDPRHCRAYNGDLRRRSPNFFRTCANN